MTWLLVLSAAFGGAIGGAIITLMFVNYMAGE